jgi:hypothetical protein
MNIVTLQDLLEDEDQILFLHQGGEKVRGLVSTFFNCRLPLESTSGKTRIKAIASKSKTSSSEKILVGLYWNALYGKNFKVYHWFSLFRVFLRTLNKDKVSEAHLAILMILSAQAGATRYQSKMKPVRSLLIRAYGEKAGQELCDKLKESLPFRLPQKGPDLEELLQVTESFIDQKAPRIPNRIGVGYKDQGSLPEIGSTPETLSNPLFVEKEDIFELCLRQVRGKYHEVLKQV